MTIKKFSALPVLLSLVLASVSYFFLPGVVVPASNFIADLFIRALKLLSLPIIFLSIFTTLINAKNLTHTKNLLARVFKYTLLTTIISATIALILFIVINPAETRALSESTSKEKVQFFKTYLSVIKDVIPSNPVEAFLNNNVLGVAFIATILGISISLLHDKEKETVQNFFNGFFKALLKISTTIIKLLPIGIFAFVTLFIDQIVTSKESFSSIIKYAICVVSANLIQGFIILPIFLKLKGLSPTHVGKSMLPALSMAFFSKSSSATLPLTLDLASRKLNIDKKTSSFSLPLCSVINMNGCAAFILITTLFVSISSGASISLMEMIPWIFISTLVAIGNAGVPMGCYFLTSALLVGMNTPLTLLGMILPLYTLFDMVETSLNVWSDICITTVVDHNLKNTEPSDFKITH